MAYVQLVIAIIMIALSIILRPKPKTPTPEESSDLEDPTADAGKPRPEVFGTVRIQSPNVLQFGDKSHRDFDVKA